MKTNFSNITVSSPTNIEQQQSIQQPESSQSSGSTSIKIREQNPNIDHREMSNLDGTIKLSPSITSKVLGFFGLRTAAYSPSAAYKRSTESLNSNSSQDSFHTATYRSSIESLSSDSSQGSFHTARSSLSSSSSSSIDNNYDYTDSLLEMPEEETYYTDISDNSSIVSSNDTQSSRNNIIRQPPPLPQRNVPNNDSTSSQESYMSVQSKFNSQTSVRSNDMFLEDIPYIDDVDDEMNSDRNVTRSSFEPSEPLYVDRMNVSVGTYGEFSSSFEPPDSAYTDRRSADTEANSSSTSQERDPLGLGPNESSYLEFTSEGVIVSKVTQMLQPVSSVKSETRTPPPIMPRPEGAQPKPRKPLTGLYNSLTNTQMIKIAEQAVDKIISGKVDSFDGPKIDFPFQIGGHGNTGYVAGTDIIVRQHVTETERQVFHFMTVLGDWLKDPNATPETAPNELKGLSYPQLSILQSFKDRLLLSLPIPLAIGGEGNATAVALLNVNKIPSEYGGFRNVSAFDPLDVSIGSKLVSKAELAAHHAEKSGGLYRMRKVINTRLMASIRGTNERRFEVKSSETGIRGLVATFRNTDEELPKRLGRLTLDQLEVLDRNVEAMQQAAYFLPVTFVGSTLQFAIPNPEDTQTMPRIMLTDVNHPLFESEIQERGLITQPRYDKYKENFTTGINAIKNVITTLIQNKS